MKDQSQDVDVTNIAKLLNLLCAEQLLEISCQAAVLQQAPLHELIFDRERSDLDTERFSSLPVLHMVTMASRSRILTRLFIAR